MRRSLTRLTLPLFLLTSTGSSTGCRSSSPPPPDYSWVRPIRFHEDTKTWLRGLDWPPTAYTDFEQIAKHNRKCEAILGPSTPPGR